MNEFNLYNSSLFKGVDEVYIDEFLASCEVVEILQGDFLFHQDEIGDAMYIIESGSLQVILNSDSENKQVLGTLNSGSLIGELCVFGQQKRSASICAQTDSKLLKIEGEDFRIRIYSKDLDALLICYNIAKLLSGRLMSTNALLSVHPSPI